jgi:ATP-dependent DNA ligase
VPDFDVPKELPFPPMEAELVRELPEGDGWQYEPKWDGFRGVLENLEGELRLWSRNARPLLRYFPELQRLGELLPPRSALDGEIVISRDGALDFDAMQTRLHPAESRIRKLSAEIPAEFIVFDQLIWDGEAVWKLTLEERRARVEALEGFVVSPATRSAADARAWLSRFEALGLDGVIAKRLGAAYVPGSREAVVKIKEHRTADCVVVGFRWKGDQQQIATLLLGLYRDDGELDYVGSCAVAAGKRREVADRLLPLLTDAPGGRISEPNRWGSGGLEEARVRPELVVEVRYDKVQGHRFRHGTKWIRWREDKDPADCTWREVLPPREPGAGVEALFGGG